MEKLTRTGQPRCEGKKLNGNQCSDPKEYLGKGRFSRWCYYCGKIITREMTPAHPGFDPRRGKIQDYDWTKDFKWTKKEGI